MANSSPEKIPLIKPPNGIVSNFENPPSLANTVTGVASVVIVLEVFFLAVRLHNNIKTFRILMIDDWMAITTTILTFGITFCLIDNRLYARHSWNISMAMIVPRSAKVALAAQIMIAPMIFAGKASVLLLYSRVFSPDQSFRRKIYAMVAITFLSNMAWIPLFCVLYSSSPNAWATIYHYSQVRAYALFEGISGVIIDLITFYLPIPVILNLQMPLRQKLGILAIFATGLCGIATGVIGLYSRINLFNAEMSGDVIYAGFIITLCSLVEAAVGVMCSSMPAMASFSRLYIYHTNPFTFLSSRLLGRKRNSERIPEVNISPNEQKKKRPNAGGKSSADSFLADSLTHLRDDSHQMYCGENGAYPRGTTTTRVQVGTESSRRDLGVVGIQKSVTIEQSTAKATDLNPL